MQQDQPNNSLYGTRGNYKTEHAQKEQNSPAVALLHPWLWPARPWSRVHLDFAGPFQGQMFLVAVVEMVE